jgi:hypothetical protein
MSRESNSSGSEIVFVTLGLILLALAYTGYSYYKHAHIILPMAVVASMACFAYGIYMVVASLWNPQDNAIRWWWHVGAPVIVLIICAFTLWRLHSMHSGELATSAQQANDTFAFAVKAKAGGLMRAVKHAFSLFLLLLSETWAMLALVYYSVESHTYGSWVNIPRSLEFFSSFIWIALGFSLIALSLSY